MRTQTPHTARRAARRTRLPALMSLMALMFTAAPAPAAEPKPGAASESKPVIGRIFFTPAERRHCSSAGLMDAADASDSRHRLVINGALRSSTRGRAVWVNGTVLKDSVNSPARTDADGNVWLTSGEHGTRRLKPGQSIDANGSIEDLLPAGSLRRQ